VDLPATLDVVRGKPAADALVLEIRMEPISKRLVLG
jgi:hypothetical protein